MKKNTTQTREVFGEEYKDWIASEKDVRFDKIWNLILVIAFIIPTVLGGLFLWHII